MQRLKALLFVSLATGQAVSQQTTDSAPIKSPAPIGIWEADDGSGGAVGINLWMPSAPGPTGARTKEVPRLLIGAYRRSGAKVRCMEENFYDTGWKRSDPLASYAAERLQIHNPLSKGYNPMDIDLRFDPAKDTWVGRFHRDNFDKEVTLRRAPDRPSHDQELCHSAGLRNLH